MDISRDIQELRVPLAINLKTTIIFRITNGSDGWRSSSFAQGPNFLWDQSISRESRKYSTCAEAVRVEADELIVRLQKTIKQARVRERVIAQVQTFLDTLPLECPAPAAAAENQAQSDTPQPLPPVVPRSPTATKKTPPKSASKTPRASTQVRAEPPPKPRRRLRASLLKKTSISTSKRGRPLRSSRSVRP